MITRFALLRHEVSDDFGRASHWDLLLERDEHCWTWSLAELPGGFLGEAALGRVEALRLPDHRTQYLEYEGPVSGGRGDVRRELEGACHWIEVSGVRVRVELRSINHVVKLVLEHVAGEQWRACTN
jgi:hypothetical protein